MLKTQIRNNKEKTMKNILLLTLALISVSCSTQKKEAYYLGYECEDHVNPEHGLTTKIQHIFQNRYDSLFQEADSVFNEYAIEPIYRKKLIAELEAIAEECKKKNEMHTAAILFSLLGALVLDDEERLSEYVLLYTLEVTGNLPNQENQTKQQSNNTTEL